MGYSLAHLAEPPGVVQWVLYPLYMACGVAIMYSLMISLAATSVWLGRNQTLYDFWFYITNFSRYPMEIYRGTVGTPLQFAVHVHHAGVGGGERAGAAGGQTAGSAVLAAGRVRAGGGGGFAVALSRLIFQAAMRSYRSASS